MRRFRFHIGTLLILVLILGVGFAALRESDETWDSSIFSLTLGMLSVSILLAIHRTERRRAFWLGFALFGWTYVGFRWSRQSNPGCSRPRRSPTLIPTFQTDLSCRRACGGTVGPVSRIRTINPSTQRRLPSLRKGTLSPAGIRLS